MTWQGVVLDLSALALAIGIGLFERRRGGMRALVALVAMIVALAITPTIGAAIASRTGGGFFTVLVVAAILLVLLLAVAAWIGRLFERRGRRRGEQWQQPPPAVASTSGARARPSAAGLGFAIGFCEGAVLAASLALLLLYLQISSPAIAPYTRGSFLARAVDRIENVLRSAAPVAPVTPVAPVESVKTTEPTTAPATEVPRTTIADLAELEAMKEVLADPALMDAIEHRNFGVLLASPELVKLWREPAFREYLAGVDRQQLQEESKRMEALADAYEIMIQAHLAGDARNALAAADDVLALDRDYGNILVMKARILETSGDRAGARALYQEARERYADAAEAPTCLGDMAADDGDLAGAEALYTEALARDPDYHFAASNRGILRCQTGRPLEGVADLVRARAARPDDLSMNEVYDQTMSILAEESLAIIAKTRSDREAWAQSLQWHLRFVEAAPDDSRTRFSLGLLYYYGVTEHERADCIAPGIEAFSNAEAKSTSKTEDLARRARAMRGNLLMRSGKVDDARALHAQLLAEGRLPLEYTAEIFTEMAVHAAAAGELERARQYIGVAVCALGGTGLTDEIFLRKYRRVDAEGAPVRCDDLEEFAPGQRLRFKSASSAVVYQGEARPQIGDVLIEIDGVTPLWPREVGELMRHSASNPPTTLTIRRGEEMIEVVVLEHLSRIDWIFEMPFHLP